jgi:hypothetical protein
MWQEQVNNDVKFLNEMTPGYDVLGKFLDMVISLYSLVRRLAKGWTSALPPFSATRTRTRRGGMNLDPRHRGILKAEPLDS